MSARARALRPSASRPSRPVRRREQKNSGAPRTLRRASEGTWDAPVDAMLRNQRELVLPRVEERVIVGKREVGREHVRITKTVETRNVDVVGEAVEEDVDIERVAVNRVVTAPPQPRVEGDVTIIPVVEEIVVVEKRFLLKEEVRVTKRRRVEQRQLRVPVRRERVAIERPESGTSTTETRKRRS